uniref:Protein Vpu n=16 Tax=Human immunodeficiency virus type 1 TaxID=11676 RepID=A0A3S7TEW9_HV1|nr:vpu protein [Human immunodeficiency virus 1]QIX06882.1 vpu protein [Human immunodeficiency virus 1]QIX06891.1 vpu protein [Human immunodeficiency virus 1]QIX06900.1 vpu protein [Human immunodeficiency virus 1]QIX06909.1 vpu protein [Human immunodeficiency virus 1]
MTPLEISAIIGLIVALIAAIVVWTIVGIEFRRILKQRKIDRIIQRIRERAEDSGNESEGDTDELAKLVEVGDFDHWVGDNV